MDSVRTGARFLPPALAQLRARNLKRYAPLHLRTIMNL